MTSQPETVPGSDPVPHVQKCEVCGSVRVNLTGPPPGQVRDKRSLTPLAKELTAFQEEVKEWSARNFGEGRTHRSALGAGEEMGELADALVQATSALAVVGAIGRLQHAELKGEQAIRHSPEEILAKKIDAVGDILVYLGHYCADSGIDMGAALKDTWGDVRERDWVAYPKNGVWE